MPYYNQRRGSAQRRNNDILPLILLFSALQRIGISNIPPVTLILFAGNVAIHFLLTHIPLTEVCLSPYYILQYNDYHRIILSAFWHANNWHLYYNMASLLWKGTKLESKLGSNRLLIFTLLSVISTSIIYVGIGMFFSSLESNANERGFDNRYKRGYDRYNNFDPNLSFSLFDSFGLSNAYHTCAVGFSGVLFSYKMILFAESDDMSSYMGFQVPARYLAWVELFAISIISPNASFLGHLCGILVGYLYNLGLFNIIFQATDQLPIDSVLNGLFHRSGNENYEEMQRNHQQNQNNQGNGFMGAIPGLGGFGRRYSRPRYGGYGGGYAGGYGRRY